MFTNLTGSQIKDTYDQILHVDGRNMSNPTRSIMDYLGISGFFTLIVDNL